MSENTSEPPQTPKKKQEMNQLSQNQNSAPRKQVIQKKTPQKQNSQSQNTDSLPPPPPPKQHNKKTKNEGSSKELKNPEKYKKVNDSSLGGAIAKAPLDLLKNSATGGSKGGGSLAGHGVKEGEDTALGKALKGDIGQKSSQGTPSSNLMGQPGSGRQFLPQQKTGGGEGGGIAKGGMGSSKGGVPEISGITKKHNTDSQGNEKSKGEKVVDTLADIGQAATKDSSVTGKLGVGDTFENIASKTETRKSYDKKRSEQGSTRKTVNEGADVVASGAISALTFGKVDIKTGRSVVRTARAFTRKYGKWTPLVYFLPLLLPLFLIGIFVFSILGPISSSLSNAQQNATNGQCNNATTISNTSSSNNTQLGSYAQYQINNALTILGVVKEEGLPKIAGEISLMVALDESTLTDYSNIYVPLSESSPYQQAVGANGTSLGIFQQQITTGWSTFSNDPGDNQAVSQLMTPAYNAEAFLGSPPGTQITGVNQPSALQKGLQNINGGDWQNVSLTTTTGGTAQDELSAAAQDVQASGTPDGSNYYAQESAAEALVNQLWGQASPVPLPVPFTGGSNTSGTTISAQCPSGSGNSSIVSIAKSQLGQECSKYTSTQGSGWGGCEPWCAVFATWVWQQAGINIPSIASVPALNTWAKNNSKIVTIINKSEIPLPGDFIIYNGNGSNYAHVGIVVDTTSTTVTTVEGDVDTTVKLVGPGLYSHSVNNPGITIAQKDGLNGITEYIQPPSGTGNNTTNNGSSGGGAVSNSQQEIVVSAPEYGSTTATLTTYQENNGNWSIVNGPVPANLGSGGLASPGAKVEGDEKTPSGIFGLGFMFGDLPQPQNLNPLSASRYVSITGQNMCTAPSCWVWDDDKTSPNYNSLIIPNLGVSAGANPEPMENTPSYNYGIVIDYNMNPVVPGAGSAIFLHVSAGGPTAGCVSIDQNTLLSILQWINPNENPIIDIGVNVQAP